MSISVRLLALEGIFANFVGRNGYGLNCGNSVVILYTN